MQCLLFENFSLISLWVSLPLQRKFYILLIDVLHEEKVWSTDIRTLFCTKQWCLAGDSGWDLFHILVKVTVYKYKDNFSCKLYTVKRNLSNFSKRRVASLDTCCNIDRLHTLLFFTLFDSVLLCLTLSCLIFHPEKRIFTLEFVNLNLYEDQILINFAFGSSSTHWH